MSRGGQLGNSIPAAMQDATAARTLPALAPQPPATDNTTEPSPATADIPVVVPEQLQRMPTPPGSTTTTPRPLVPLQPRPRLTPAHLTAAIAVVASRPVSPSPRSATTIKSTAPKPRGKRNSKSSTPVGWSAPLLAAAASALNALSDDSTTATSPTLTDQQDTDGNRPVRKMKKCSVSFCESYARSRGLCKAHGGGKRCMRPGCEVSDQGGGFCIRHGGGKRCLVEGCDKSAQSRHYCKAHGGGARCMADGCVKSSQGGGLCRAHGGGPRRKRAVNHRGELVESPRARKRTKYRAEMAARTLVGAAQAIVEQEAQDEQDDEDDRMEGSNASPLEIERRDDDMEKSGNEGGKSLNNDRDTHLFVAASLLGMQAASTK